MKIRNIVLAILLYLLFLNSSFAKNPSDFIQEITDNASKILSSDLSKNEKQNKRLVTGNKVIMALKELEKIQPLAKMFCSRLTNGYILYDLHTGKYQVNNEVLNV